MKKLLFTLLALVMAMPLWAQADIPNFIYLRTNTKGGKAAIGWKLTSDRIVQDNFVKNGCHNYVSKIVIDGVEFPYQGVNLSDYGLNISKPHDIYIVFNQPLNNISGIFANCYNIEQINMNYFDASRVVNMKEFILGTVALKSIVLPSNFNVDKLKGQNITSVDVTALTSTYCKSERYYNYVSLFNGDGKIYKTLKSDDYACILNDSKLSIVYDKNSKNNNAVAQQPTVKEEPVVIEEPKDEASMLARGKDSFMHCKYDDAFKYLSQAADLGNQEAKYYVARCYYNGYSVDEDNATAVKMLKSLTTAGYLPANYHLGLAYENGKGGLVKNKTTAQTHYKKAFPEIKRLAEMGDANMQFCLGVCYEFGCGTAKDEEKAVKWYRKAAEQGSAFAQYNLGGCYYNGQGVLPDYYEGVKWWRKAAEQGYDHAQYCMGYAYENGKGVSTDYKEAMKWYKMAAEQGNIDAMCGLGYMYNNGRGVSRDYQMAAIYYRKAADKGNATAQCNLAIFYCDGKGVAQSDAEAVKWYRKAAEQGDASAMCGLGWMYERGRGVAKSYAQAMKWYRKAADKGDATAQYNIGLNYYYGRGVAKSKSTAKVWLQKAADQGYQNAKDFLWRNY